MAKVPFTEFVLPDGRRVEGYFDVAADIAETAAALRERGYRFEVERLRTGEVSLECCGTDNDGEHDSLAMLVVPNGPGMRDHVEQLVRNAQAELERRDGADDG